MADPPENDPCKKVSKHHGRSTATSAEYSWDDAWTKALNFVRDSAAIDAETWAMTIPCPQACPFRQMELEIDEPTDPHVSRGRDGQGHHIWNGTSTADWNATVTCVQALPGNAGTVPADGTGVFVDDEHRRAKCDEQVRADDTSSGRGSTVVQLDPQGAKATEKANEAAMQNAYLAANKAVLDIRCRSRCPKRTIIIVTSTPKAGAPQKKDVLMPDETTALPCWLVTSTCQWKAFVTCHD